MAGNGRAGWSAIGGLTAWHSAAGAAEYSTRRPTRWPVNLDPAEWKGVEYALSQAAPEVAALYLPIELLPPSEVMPPAHKRPRLTTDVGPELAERLRHESLRDLAVTCDVSHETIRKAARQAWQARLASS